MLRSNSWRRENYPTLVRLLAYTGLLWGEAIALRVKDLDLPRKRSNVVENAVQIDQATVVAVWAKCGQTMNR